MKQVEVREGARRQHRAIALFAAIQCWVNKTDGVIFTRAQLLRLLGLQQFKDARVKWMKLDFRPLFEHRRTLPLGSIHSLSHFIVARRPFEGFFPNEETNPKKIVEALESHGLRLHFFTMWPPAKTAQLESTFEAVKPLFAGSANYNERLLTSYLALLAQGQISARDIPWLATPPINPGAV
jgi:hypothetical protein